ncbi:MAG: YjbQ family protein [Candidatus Diapherotrites archaeon]|nr:YjbQ family protein [Candidatus Diapherotrites archaeon]
MELSIKSEKKTEFIDITSRINELIQKNKIKEGISILFVPHTTAAVTVNEGFDSNVLKDIEKKLNELIPENPNFLHSEGNSDAHIKSSIIGASETILIKENQLLLGQWQKIFFCEFDGPRKRKIIIKLIKEKE